MFIFDALDWTDKVLEQMEKHLTAIYRRAQRELGVAWKAYMNEADEKVKALGKAYGEAKKTGDKETIRAAGIAVSKAKQERTIMNRHYQQLTLSVAESITHVNEIAAAYVNGQLPAIYAANYNEVARNIGGSGGGGSGGGGRLDIDIRFDLVDPHTIKRLSTTQENLLPYKTVNHKKDVRWNVAKINAEVTQGILQGESIPKIARRLSAVLKMNEASAIRNARTTVTSAQNKGRIDMMHDAADAGVIMKKGWSAAHDKRVRPSHQHVDGEFVDMDDEFSNGLEYPGDPDGDPEEVYNCRCALIYDVVGFRR